MMKIIKERFAASLMLFTIVSCSHSVPSPHTNAMTLRFLALGDSYTIGERVDADQRWPEQLAARLREGGIPIGGPEIIVRTGWTTDELNAAIDAAHPQGPYDLVTLLIGVNNQYRGRSAEEYREQFRALLARAVGFAGGRASRVVVLSIPDWGSTPFAEGRDRSKIGSEIDHFNAIAREITKAAGARWVGVTSESKKAATESSMVAPDGLHPSGAMYAEWTALALPAAKAALGR